MIPVGLAALAISLKMLLSKRRVAAVTSSIVAVVAIAWGAFGLNIDLEQASVAHNETVCGQNMRHLAMAMLLYEEDYDEHYPIQTKWASSIQPYYRRLPGDHNGDSAGSVLHCPCASSPFSYAFNSSLAATDNHDSNRVMLFESDASVLNALGTKSQLVLEPRHGVLDSYCFEDGRCHSMQRARESALRW